MDEPILEQPVLFISDAHLGGFSKKENDRIECELIQLIDYCQRNRIRIAVLGDLFDYWMEYPDHVPQLGQRVLERFEAFNHHMGPSLYITGNHDNWTRDHLQDRGFFLVHEHHCCKLGQKKVMLLHGDGLGNPALGLPRPLSHRLLRNQKFIKGYQTLLPPTWGVTIMKYFSRLNRRYNSTEDPAPLNHWARKVLKESGKEIIICGHDHIPRRKQFSFGTYINLGTFHYQRTMALYNNNDVSLVFWEHIKKTLHPFKNKTDNRSTLTTIHE